ncbi:membrane dipeptidase [Hyalangium minutum]|uniref:Peptidase, M19 family protein n=1 Tax=Hyalangium minutum TaxID=394096 RepID=A0A085WWI1_9BACT|nr:membrane dipeptidase [Hyalangium minutum]KFE72044.1 peptidase, M19 family protein [Hyalangium minutum]
MQRLPRVSRSGLLSLGLTLAVLQGCGPTEEEVPVEPAKVQQGLGVPGFAELHHHMFAEQAFGGGWFHGSYTGTLNRCDGGMPESSHARVRMDLSNLLNLCPNSGGVDLRANPLLAALFGVGGAVGSEFIAKMEGTQGDTGLHLGRRDVPTQWPRWDTIAHQQAWEGWLRKAKDGGLSLVMVSLVSNGFLCNALPYQNLKRPCDEMADIEVQLQMARDFDARTDWVEIALSPAHARQIIASGKLAMVLSIETSKLFGSKDWRTELDRFYSLGVRSLQPVHQLDNRFAGAAPHNAIFQAAEFLENCHIDTDCGVTTGSFTLGFDVDSACRNVKGLTPEGKAMVQAMMSKGMLVDMAHMSERSVQDTFALAQTNTYYPLMISHGHFREVMNPKVAEQEKSTPSWVVRYLRQTGGMFGLRTAHDEVRTYTKTAVANNCHGSTRSLAQAYEFGRQGLKVPMAFGADLNGFIQQTRPRFGPNGACSATFQAEADVQAYQQTLSGPGRLGTEFDENGLAHIGLLPDLLRDLKNLGVNTTGLENSAETFIRMWERATAARTGMADAASDIDTSGVAPYVSKETREAQFPTVCGMAYAPDSKVLGQGCRFDAECQSDQCTSVLCSTFDGRCVCNDDGDCGSASYCQEELPGPGDNDCVAKKANWVSCSRDGQCQSGACGGCATLTGWCYTPRSKAYGQACKADRECTTDRCSADCYINPTGSCLCQSDSHCASNQYCGWGTNSGKCQNKKSRGAACASDRECVSNNCRWSFTCG